MSYKPQPNYISPMRLLKPTESTIVGVTKKTFTEPEDSPLFYGSFRTFSGTETTENGVYTLLDTGLVETWYRPDITADCRIFLEQTRKTYEITGSPENIGMRNQRIVFRVKAVGGKA